MVGGDVLFSLSVVCFRVVFQCQCQCNVLEFEESERNSLQRLIFLLLTTEVGARAHRRLSYNSGMTTASHRRRCSVVAEALTRPGTPNPGLERGTPATVCQQRKKGGRREWLAGEPPRAPSC